MGNPKKTLKPASLSEAKRLGVLVGAAPFVRKRGYIGGTPAQARQAYWDTDNEMYMLTDSVARTYGIAPELLRARMDREGYTDARIKELNADYTNKTNRALLGQQLFNSPAMPYVAGEEFGLDDVATYINDGRVQLINENWGDGQFRNEKGRWTNMAMGHNYSDNIGIMAATLKAMRDQAKKDFPKASEADLDRYAGAYYNRGFTGGKQYAKTGGKGYKVRRTLETGGKVDNNQGFWDTVDNYADYAEKALALGSLASMGATIAAPNPVTAGLAVGTSLGGAAVDGYQAIRAGLRGDWGNVGKNGFELLLGLVGAKALRNASKLSQLDDALRASGAPRQYVTRTVGRRPGHKHHYTTTKENAAASTAYTTGAAANIGGNASSMGSYPERNKKSSGGSIHIAPSKRGTFTAAATKHGMGVQEFASRVLRNKDSYSPAMVKKANFARNASKWNH